MRKILLVVSVFTFLSSSAQSGLLNGTGYVPDITVTDVNGNIHNLYNYLGGGKIVVLEMLSTTCGTCLMYTAGTKKFLSNIWSLRIGCCRIYWIRG